MRPPRRPLTPPGAKAAVVAPVGFISDHMEVLYDLDDEAKDEGGRSWACAFRRAGTAGTDPRFVDMLVELIRERLGEVPEKRAAGEPIPPEPRRLPEELLPEPVPAGPVEAGLSPRAASGGRRAGPRRRTAEARARGTPKNLEGTRGFPGDHPKSGLFPSHVPPRTPGKEAGRDAQPDTFHPPPRRRADPVVDPPRHARRARRRSRQLRVRLDRGRLHLLPASAELHRHGRRGRSARSSAT